MDTAEKLFALASETGVALQRFALGKVGLARHDLVVEAIESEGPLCHDGFAGDSPDSLRSFALPVRPHELAIYCGSGTSPAIRAVHFLARLPPSTWPIGFDLPAEEEHSKTTVWTRDYLKASEGGGLPVMGPGEVVRLDWHGAEKELCPGQEWVQRLLAIVGNEPTKADARILWAAIEAERQARLENFELHQRSKRGDSEAQREIERLIAKRESELAKGLTDPVGRAQQDLRAVRDAMVASCRSSEVRIAVVLDNASLVEFVWSAQDEAYHVGFLSGGLTPS